MGHSWDNPELKSKLQKIADGLIWPQLEQELEAFEGVAAQITSDAVGKGRAQSGIHVRLLERAGKKSIESLSLKVAQILTSVVERLGVGPGSELLSELQQKHATAVSRYCGRVVQRVKQSANKELKSADTLLDIAKGIIRRDALELELWNSSREVQVERSEATDSGQSVKSLDFGEHPLLEEFDSDRTFLERRVHYQDAGSRLSGFLGWMKGEQEITRILEDLERRASLEELLEGVGGRVPPRASTPEDAAALGLYFARECGNGRDLHDVAISIGVHPPTQSTQAQDYCDEAFERYVVPLLDWIERRLRDLVVRPDTDDVVGGRVAGIFSEACRSRFPRTVEQLSGIAPLFDKLEDDHEWSNVGNSCRSALLAFASELRDETGIELSEGTKAGDVKSILKQVAEGNGRFDETLRGLIGAVWDHAQSLTHRDGTEKVEAMRLFTWTALLVVEFDTYLTAG